MTRPPVAVALRAFCPALARFEDRDAGGFFFTAHDHEVLIHRPKTGHDNATPAGNGVAAFALQRLGHLLGWLAAVITAHRLHLTVRRRREAARAVS